MSDAHQLPIGSLVELKPNAEELYRLAVAGSRGWIREHSIDEYGYPLVSIDWDKDHWRYNGEPDGWTFEGHFELLEAPPEKELLIHPVARARDLLSCEDCGGIHDEETDRIAEYLEVLNGGVDSALGGDGYLIFTLTPEIGELGERKFVPRVFCSALDPKVFGVLEAHIELLREMFDDEPGR